MIPDWLKSYIYPILIGIMILSYPATWIHGHHAGVVSTKQKIKEQIDADIEKGRKGSADALRKFDAGKLSDTWWID